MFGENLQTATLGRCLNVACALGLVAGLPSIAAAQVTDPGTVQLPRLERFS